jgi:hypothetical protein
LSEAENILKTKGKRRGFSKNEAENILKQSQLLKTVGIPEKHDKMTIRKGPLGRRQAAEEADRGLLYGYRESSIQGVRCG